MPEEILRTALHRVVDHIDMPAGAWEKVRKKITGNHRKRVRLRLLAAAASIALLLTITVGSITPAGADVQKSWLFKTKLGATTLSIVQNIGEGVTGITPTLFLPTTLSHAKQVAKMSVKVPSYLPRGIYIDDNTPTLVGRFGSDETVAIEVAEKVKLVNGSGDRILLDIRQTTAKELEANYPKDISITTEKVKINKNDGLLVSREGICPTLYWNDGQYSFRMFGPEKKEDLIRIAESMK